MSVRDEQHDVEWLAFCYAANELSPAEAAAFEQRLGIDQAAREALAQAVELTQAIAVGKSLEPVAPPDHRRREAAVARYQGKRSTMSWSRRLAWMALGSAASLLVALLWSRSGLGPQQQPQLAGDGIVSPETGELAAAWSATRQELAASEGDLWYPAHLETHWEREFVSDDLATDDLLVDGSDPALPATPAWLTAAVLSSAGLPADAIPFDDERGDN